MVGGGEFGLAATRRAQAGRTEGHQAECCSGREAKVEVPEFLVSEHVARTVAKAARDPGCDFKHEQRKSPNSPRLNQLESCMLDG